MYGDGVVVWLLFLGLKRGGDVLRFCVVVMFWFGVYYLLKIIGDILDSVIKKLESKFYYICVCIVK